MTGAALNGRAAASAACAPPTPAERSGEMGEREDEASVRRSRIGRGIRGVYAQVMAEPVPRRLLDAVPGAAAPAAAGE